MEITDQVGNIPAGISVSEALKKLNIDYFSMSNAAELLPLAVRKYKPDKEIMKSIEKEFEQYGVSTLRLA
jgi:hypothetical protein